MQWSARLAEQATGLHRLSVRGDQITPPNGPASPTLHNGRTSPAKPRIFVDSRSQSPTRGGTSDDDQLWGSVPAWSSPGSRFVSPEANGSPKGVLMRPPSALQWGQPLAGSGKRPATANREPTSPTNVCLKRPSTASTVRSSTATVRSPAFSNWLRPSSAPQQQLQQQSQVSVANWLFSAPLPLHRDAPTHDTARRRAPKRLTKGEGASRLTPQAQRPPSPASLEEAPPRCSSPSALRTSQRPVRRPSSPAGRLEPWCIPTVDGAGADADVVTTLSVSPKALHRTVVLCKPPVAAAAERWRPRSKGAIF